MRSCTATTSSTSRRLRTGAGPTLVAVLLVALSGCGSSSSSAPASASSPSSSVSSSPSSAGDDTSGSLAGKGTGTFSMTGARTMRGALTDVVCAELNKDNYVAYGHYRPPSGDVIVSIEVPSPHPDGDQEEANEVSIDGSDTVTYNRFSSSDKPLDNVRHGSHILGHVTLLDTRDITVEDDSKRHYVDLTADFDCGDQLG